jgi:hypothetical protein
MNEKERNLFRLGHIRDCIPILKKQIENIIIDLEKPD